MFVFNIHMYINYGLYVPVQFILLSMSLTVCLPMHKYAKLFFIPKNFRTNTLPGIKGNTL